MPHTARKLPADLQAAMLRPDRPLAEGRRQRRGLTELAWHGGVVGGCECAACVVCDLLTATVPEFKYSIIASAIYSGATPLFWPPEQRPD